MENKIKVAINTGTGIRILTNPENIQEFEGRSDVIIDFDQSLISGLKLEDISIMNNKLIIKKDNIKPKRLLKKPSSMEQSIAHLIEDKKVLNVKPEYLLSKKEKILLAVCISMALIAAIVGILKHV